MAYTGDALEETSNKTVAAKSGRDSGADVLVIAAGVPVYIVCFCALGSRKIFLRINILFPALVSTNVVVFRNMVNRAP